MRKKENDNAKASFKIKTKFSQPLYKEISSIRHTARWD